MKNISSTIENIIDGNIPMDTYNISDEITYTYSKLLTNHKKNNGYHIPTFLIKWLYHIGQMMKNIFIKENAIKLISDNIYPSAKIKKDI